MKPDTVCSVYRGLVEDKRHGLVCNMSGFKWSQSVLFICSPASYRFEFCSHDNILVDQCEEFIQEFDSVKLGAVQSNNNL